MKNGECRKEIVDLGPDVAEGAAGVNANAVDGDRESDDEKKEAAAKTDANAEKMLRSNVGVMKKTMAVGDLMTSNDCGDTVEERVKGICDDSMTIVAEGVAEAALDCRQVEIRDDQKQMDEQVESILLRHHTIVGPCCHCCRCCCRCC